MNMEGLASDKGILISWSGTKVLVLHPPPVLEEVGILEKEMKQ